MTYDYPFKNADDKLIRAVWEKAITILTLDHDVFRLDKCGKYIKFSEHGNTNSEYGWEIDHIIPKSLGGSDELWNLRPLHWRNNRAKGDSISWNCG